MQNATDCNEDYHDITSELLIKRTTTEYKTYQYTSLLKPNVEKERQLKQTVEDRKAENDFLDQKIVTPIDSISNESIVIIKKPRIPPELEAQRQALYTKAKNGIDLVVYDSQCSIETFHDDKTLNTQVLEVYKDLDFNSN